MQALGSPRLCASPSCTVVEDRNPTLQAWGTREATLPMVRWLEYVRDTSAPGLLSETDVARTACWEDHVHA